MRHVLVALALMWGPVGPAVCELACADASPVHAMAMPGCHMMQDEDGGPVVTDADTCRHPESRPALVTPVQDGTDTAWVAVDAGTALRQRPVAARAFRESLTPSPPLTLPPIPLRR